jgi:anti-anti-sigma regulatory factor
MFKFNIDQLNSNGKLVLEGILTIQNSALIKKTILESLGQVNHLIVSHETGESFDLSYIQILIAAHITSVDSGKSFEINSHNPESFVCLLKEMDCISDKWLFGEIENMGGN